MSSMYLFWCYHSHNRFSHRIKWLLYLSREYNTEILEDLAVGIWKIKYMYFKCVAWNCNYDDNKYKLQVDFNRFRFLVTPLRFSHVYLLDKVRRGQDRFAFTKFDTEPSLFSRRVTNWARCQVWGMGNFVEKIKDQLFVSGEVQQNSTMDVPTRRNTMRGYLHL